MKSFEMNEELINKIIAVAYGDAGIKDKFIVRRLSKKHEEVHKLLESYKSIAVEVHKIKEDECPEYLLNNLPVQNLAGYETKKFFWTDAYSMIFSRPIVSVATTIILVAAIAFGVLSNRKFQYTHTYSDSEVQLAEKQAKQAFAIVGRIFDETRSTLKDEVLKSRVADTFDQSIGIVNDLINKGEIR